ncbi:superoxide dismutase [Nocardioides perillae]|uniref:Sugar lactone lactonase YvrE n=1 Tax=Nocardioides perillae TaxID=1119534 RepID=A0A7Y9RSW7_9ACTN|nr:superoxide dismutase [Nocardioides perillae]NYG54288.1 sugar lactone lactonase YvrE [Nocardioides perillae]
MSPVTSPSSSPSSSPATARAARTTRRARLAVSVTSVAAVGALLGAAGVAAPGASAAPAERFPDRIELPDGFQPEGITVGRGATAFFGSRADGDVYRVDLRTGEGRTISQGPGTPSVGLKVDQRCRVFVAGGPAGDARVVDGRTGELLASYRLAPAGSPTFVNDVVLTEDTVWLTDSQSPVLYALPLGPGGALPAEPVRVPLGGEWQQGTGFGANGLTETPDGSALLVVNSGTGLLYRVDPVTGEATQVDLGGARLTNGDGLLLEGTTLYAVLNRQEQVAVVELSADGTSGEVVRTLTDDDFDVPTTVARFGGSLYLPNARFSTPPTPTTEYWVTRIDRR